MTNPRGVKTAVQMQDDPLSKFSASAHLCADGTLKPQRRKRILVFEDAKLQVAKEVQRSAPKPMNVTKCSN